MIVSTEGKSLSSTRRQPFPASRASVEWVLGRVKLARTNCTTTCRNPGLRGALVGMIKLFAAAYLGGA
jgi:hypothetical protein